MPCPRAAASILFWHARMPISDLPEQWHRAVVARRTERCCGRPSRDSNMLITAIGSGDLMLGFAGHEHLFVGHDPLAIERHYRTLNHINFHYGRCWPLDL